MVSVSNNQACVFDLESSVVSFMNDSSQQRLELPEWLNAAQRKAAKTYAEREPELQCESFGFGAERRLHIFKQARRNGETAETAGTTVCVKNTFIDDWFSHGSDSDVNSDDMMFRSLPASKVALGDTFASNLTALDLSVVHSGSPASTCASVGMCNSPRTPSCISQTPTPTRRHILAGTTDFEVRNTFVHVDELSDDAVDSRQVQSMPSGMFGQCLADSVAEQLPIATRKSVRDAPEEEPLQSMLATPSPTKMTQKKALRACVLEPGTQVTIQGLVKAPQFNGKRGFIKGYDEKAARYEIQLLAESHASSAPVAKVKAEHLRLQSPSASGLSSSTAR